MYLSYLPAGSLPRFLALLPLISSLLLCLSFFFRHPVSFLPSASTSETKFLSFLRLNLPNGGLIINTMMRFTQSVLFGWLAAGGYSSDTHTVVSFMAQSGIPDAHIKGHYFVGVFWATEDSAEQTTTHQEFQNAFRGTYAFLPQVR